MNEKLKNMEPLKEEMMESELSPKPPQYTEEEKQAFFKAMQEYEVKHPHMVQNQKKFRSKLTHLIPKKKKRK